MSGIILNIRDVSSDDYQGICSLITSEEELFLVYPRGIYPLTIDQMNTLAQTRKALTVVTVDGKIIAFANLYDFEEGRFAFIGNVVVDKEFRGKGIGKEVIAHMLKKARQQFKLPEIRISVFANNTTALLLYSGFDFVPYALEERMDVQGNRAALIHMRKPLR
jgi:ribosomal protein S18 acetylase RimI-like enzyme